MGAVVNSVTYVMTGAGFSVVAGVITFLLLELRAAQRDIKDLKYEVHKANEAAKEPTIRLPIKGDLAREWEWRWRMVRLDPGNSYPMSQIVQRLADEAGYQHIPGQPSCFGRKEKP